MGGCQNYGPFLGPYYNTGPNTGPNLGDPKRDHNFDNPPILKMHLKFLLLPLSVLRLQPDLLLHRHPGKSSDLHAQLIV